MFRGFSDAYIRFYFNLKRKSEKQVPEKQFPVFQTFSLSMFWNVGVVLTWGSIS